MMLMMMMVMMVMMFMVYHYNEDDDNNDDVFPAQTEVPTFVIIVFILRRGCLTMKTSSAKPGNCTDTSSKFKLQSLLTIFQN